MKSPLVVYWVRRDFRMRDNPALSCAVVRAQELSAPIFPLFILEEYMCRAAPDEVWGYMQRAFVAQAVPAFLSLFPSAAVVRGKVVATFELLAQTHALEIFVNEDIYHDFFTQIKKLRAKGIIVTVLSDQLTVSKDTVSGKGTHYSIFTPFKHAVWDSFLKASEYEIPVLGSISYKAVSETPLHAAALPLNTEALMNACTLSRTALIGDRVYDIDDYLSSRPSTDFLYTTEAQAQSHALSYIQTYLETYKTDRDSLELSRTSQLSVALTWGLISARTLVTYIKAHCRSNFDTPTAVLEHESAVHYISELIWREFYKYLLFHNPALMNTEFQAKFRGRVEWVSDSVAHERFIAWIKGETGYPLVDAAMMQLAQTGLMHNRARMLVASVLTKNLGVDWRWGQAYFRAMLLDLDEASNNGGWQWGASVGADPKPIRIFNPALQAARYDAHEVYQKTWLPKERFVLALPPIVPHVVARADALRRYGLHETHGVRDY